MPEDNDNWDGRPPFYPQSGYELDAHHCKEYKAFCEREGIYQGPDREFETMDSEEEHSYHGEENPGNEKDDEDNESSDDDHDSSGSDGAGYLSRKVIYAPPLYDQGDHFHDLYKDDQNYFRCFSISDSGKRLFQERLFRKFSREATWYQKVAQDAMSLIEENRETVPSIARAIQSSSCVVLQAQVKGLRNGAAPVRRIQVPGKLPLSTLHDRVLCPAFGWTRGYHDYRFLVPASGYKHGPPKIPILDVVFGATSVNHVASAMICNHGYHGTLRSGDTVPTIPDSNVRVADLLHEPGHCLWHVLGQPGWKTELVVEYVEPNADSLRPKLLTGENGGLPESFVLDLDLSTDSCVDEFDCGGPHAFALAHEMIRRGNESDEALWMKRHVLGRRMRRKIRSASIVPLI